jgi:hypothetical protein
MTSSDLPPVAQGCTDRDAGAGHPISRACAAQPLHRREGPPDLSRALLQTPLARDHAPEPLGSVVPGRLARRGQSVADELL